MATFNLVGARGLVTPRCLPETPKLIWVSDRGEFATVTTEHGLVVYAHVCPSDHKQTLFCTLSTDHYVSKDGDVSSPVIHIRPSDIARLTNKICDEDLRCASWGRITMARMEVDGTKIHVYKHPILTANIVGKYKKVIVMDGYSFLQLAPGQLV